MKKNILKKDVINLFIPVSNGFICTLCPNYCRLEKEERGKCGVRKCTGTEIVLETYGCISCLTTDIIEKKPFRNFLSGTRTLSVGSVGCNLNCKFCENFSISQYVGEIYDQLKPDDIITKAFENNCESICMTYNEPTISYEFLVDLAKASKSVSLPFLLNTNAYINKEPWEYICNLTDAMNIDWKGSKKVFSSITGYCDYVTEKRIKEAYDSGVHLEINIPLYYEDEDIEEEIEGMGKFLSSIDPLIPCHLLRISPSYEYEDFIFDFNNFKKAYNVLSKYMINIFF